MRRPGLTLVACALSACGGGGREGVANAVLVTLDTTRADALGCYGAVGDPTPRLDAFARGAVLYEHASTAVPLTLPAHCSMMTGLYPPRHTVRDNGYRPLPASASTLAERARDAGLETAAFLGAVVLDRQFALDQGFDVYDAPGPGSERRHGERSAQDVIGRAIAWLDGRERERRFLLWVHLFDPHTPYAAPEARTDLTPYAAEVSYMDRELGRLFDRLAAEGLLASTSVLVVGDHGEAFGEHDELKHGAFCYETTLRVPFLLAHPPGHPNAERAGERDTGLVSVVDVQPTLLDALGLELPEDIDGFSLLDGPLPPERGVYFESYTGYLSLGWSPLAGWRDAHGKYLHSSSPQLFDVERDPGETRDLVPDGAAELRPYQLALADVAHKPRLAEGDATGSAELLEELRGLGYTSVGAPREALPDPLAPSDRPSPQAKAREHHETLVALQRFDEGDVEGAYTILARVAAHNPGNLFVLDTLGYSLIRLGRHAEAIEPLERLLRERPERGNVWANLGICLLEEGRVEEAEGALRRALELEPRHVAALRTLDRLLESEGRGLEADELRARALQPGGGDGGGGGG